MGRNNSKPSVRVSAAASRADAAMEDKKKPGSTGAFDLFLLDGAEAQAPVFTSDLEEQKRIVADPSEPLETRLEVAGHTLPLLPADKPRYIMGVGTPAELVELVALGADMFDCVMPTRNARNGQLFTTAGTLNIRNSCYQADVSPVDEHCGCYACRHFSRAYLRHLFMARELLAYRLATIHNVYYFVQLLKSIRTAVMEGTFDQFRDHFYAQREMNA